jgi:hypothetical protein
MNSLKAVFGFTMLLVASLVSASEFQCPVPSHFQNVECAGSIEVKNLADLISYKSNLAAKKGKAKNLIIDFDINSNGLSISTP